MGLDSPVFMTAKQVANFLKQYSFNNRSGKSKIVTFEQIKSKLRSDAEICKIEEQKGYNIFKVDSIEELQKKIDEINSSGLIAFSATAYNSSSFAKQYAGTMSDSEFNEAISNQLNKEIDKQIQEGTIEKDISKNISNLILQQIGGKETDLNGKEYPKFHIKFKIDDFRNGKNVNFATRAHKQVFTAWINKKSDVNCKSTWDMTVQYNSNDFEQAPTDLRYYPYFKLTSDEKVEAVSNSAKAQQIWSNFKTHLGSLIYNDSAKAVFDTIMEKMGIQSFIQDTSSGVKGVLGELQMLLIAAALSGDTTNLQYVANETKNGKKLSTDLVLENGLGIQVKNYTGYIDKQTQGQGYNIHKTYKWNDAGGMANILLKNLDPSTVINIGEYFAACSYNRPISDATEQYRNMFTHMESRTGPVYTTTQSYLSESIGNFLTLPQAQAIIAGDTAEGQQLIDKPDYLNVFYMISGRIVPASAIYNLLLYRVEKMEELIKHKEHGQMYGFTVSPRYGKTHWDWVDSDPETNTKTISQILSEVSFSINLNLYIPELDYVLKNR